MFTRLQFLTVVISCIAFTGTGSHLSAQPASFNRLIHVTINDPGNRFVTGFEQSNFSITENGTPRPVSYFSSGDAPVSLAIVGIPTSADAIRLKRPEDEWILTQSVSDAVRELAASKNSRKALIVADPADAQGLSSDIQILTAGQGSLTRPILAVLNSYTLGFQSSDPSSSVEVTLGRVQGLPPLTLTKN